MSRFFSYFPKTPYTLDNGANLNLVTNILKRMKFDDSLKNNAVTYYEYTIQEGDKPENVAHKIYGDVEQHWIILLLNDIIDVYSQWPLDYEAFKKMLIDKYGSVATAQATIYQYTKTVTYTNMMNLSSRPETFVITQDAYDVLPAEPSTLQYSLTDGSVVNVTTSRSSLSAYDYEVALNESKRQIKIMKPELVNDIMTEFITMMEENG